MREQRKGCRGRHERHPIADLPTSPRWSRMNDSGRLQGFPGDPAGRVLPPMQEVPAGSLSQGDALEKEMAARSSTLAWEIQGRRSLAGYSPRPQSQARFSEPSVSPTLADPPSETLTGISMRSGPSERASGVKGAKGSPLRAAPGGTHRRGRQRLLRHPRTQPGAGRRESPLRRGSL